MQDSPRASAPHALAAIPCCLSSQSGAVAGGMQLTAGRAGEGTELRRGARHAHAWYAAISERVDAQGRGCATEGLAGRAFCTAGGSKIKGHFGWRWWWWLTHWHILARPFGPSLPQAPPSLLQPKVQHTGCLQCCLTYSTCLGLCTSHHSQSGPRGRLQVCVGWNAAFQARSARCTTGSMRWDPSQAASTASHGDSALHPGLQPRRQDRDLT